MCIRDRHRVGKNAGRVWSCLWTKVHDILGRCRRLLVVVNALDRCLSCSLRRRRPLKFAAELRSRPKRWFFDPRFAGEGDPRILDVLFQIALTSDYVADFRWVPFSELGDQTAKKEERIRGKNKSADMDVRRPNKYSMLNHVLNVQLSCGIRSSTW